MDAQPNPQAALEAALASPGRGKSLALDEVVRLAYPRLQHLADRLLNDYPVVRLWTQADDVLQEALVRLVGALTFLRAASAAEFFGLASLEIRRALSDLARKFSGPRWAFTHGHAERMSPACDDVAGVLADLADLEPSSAIHEAIEKLPVFEREVVSLKYYHGWTNAEMAELFQVKEETVRLHYHDAPSKLRCRLRAPEVAV
jgi:RNA polymerase sigma-70 factor (ECF subfamily)